jgi:DNA polymerase elongation subunit (family B)
MYMPVLPVKDDNDILLTPCGSWSGWYFSEEIKDAISYGYTIKPRYGYKFKRGKDIFTKFVQHFYSIKVSGDTVLRTIAKLILNSLYGKFGAREYNTETKIMTETAISDLFQTHDILDIVPLIDSDKSLVTYEKFPNESKCKEHHEDYMSLLEKLDHGGYKNDYISVAIASAITAYARIHINKLKHMKGLTVIYTDTDSIVTTTPIDSKYIGSEIGQLKLETEIYEGLFAAPKVYYIESPDKSKSKAKGIGNSLTKEEFSKLIRGESVTSTKSYWQRNISRGEVEVVNRPFVTTALFQKRVKVFDDNGT